MPALESFVFANNKGGSGKTFTLFQVVNQVALAHPDCKVLVIDFSVHSDSSCLLMGGSRRKISQPEIGLLNTVSTSHARVHRIVLAV